MKTFKWAKHVGLMAEHENSILILKVVSIGNVLVFTSLFIILIVLKTYIQITGDINARWILVLIGPLYIPTIIVAWFLGTASLVYRIKTNKKVTIQTVIANQINLVPMAVSMYLTFN